jgi:predicted dehydrogenase
MALNVAFYGAGGRAQPYLQALARRPRVQVVAVCDPDRRAAEQAAAGWEARVFAEPEAMLDEARPDALWVCVPPAGQGNVLLRAAEMGVPFFVEPPGAVDLAGAVRCAEAAVRNGLVTAVGYHERYADLVQEAGEYLGANPVPLALGWWLRPPEGPADVTRLWWDEGCRLVDVLRRFCGAVSRVRALRAGDGGLVVELEFARGGVAVVTCAAFARPEPRVELELLGDGWSLAFGEEFKRLWLAERDKTTILRRLNDPVADHVAAFVTAVESGHPGDLATRCAEVLPTVAVCHAALVSAREGRTVSGEELGREA